MLLKSDFEDYGYTEKEAYQLFRILRSHASTMKTEEVHKEYMFKGKMIKGLVSQTSIDFDEVRSVIERLRKINHYRFNQENVTKIEEVLTYKINKTLS